MLAILVAATLALQFVMSTITSICYFWWFILLIFLVAGAVLLRTNQCPLSGMCMLGACMHAGRMHFDLSTINPMVDKFILFVFGQGFKEDRPLVVADRLFEINGRALRKSGG